MRLSFAISMSSTGAVSGRVLSRPTAQPGKPPFGIRVEAHDNDSDVVCASALIRQSDEFFRSPRGIGRSEEHTSELQSQSNLVCRLLLEKKKKTRIKLVTMIRSPTMARWAAPPLPTTTPASAASANGYVPSDRPRLPLPSCTSFSGLISP